MQEKQPALNEMFIKVQKCLDQMVGLTYSNMHYS